ncbi:copper resistance CopC family protein [Nonomuraea turcica]|uniref:copper resistance CopC family protein n=1 Tax=Nonomuraea sp. G32 TaxID=3067274 RepID=UPI00273B3F15|nr:copper resistance CopC family protein [Nonomuraea sp. G32]MDP4505451.1 copper resistance protein CopC [Nonomuraea sp. G32]
MLTAVSVGGPAVAHAALKSSDPKDGSTVKENISSIELVFSEDINARYATVVVTGPGGAKVADGKPQVEGETVTQALKPDLANGRYAIAFRVVSADGHPVAEELHFTLNAPTPEPSPSETDSAEASPTQSPASPLPSSPDQVTTTPAAADSAGNGGATSFIVLLVVAALVLIVGVVVFLTGRRRAGDAET